MKPTCLKSSLNSQRNDYFNHQSLHVTIKNNKNIHMKQLLIWSILIITIGLSSCRKDFSTKPSTGNLDFSKDTVYLDTIFSGISSSTYTLKVYNRSSEDIHIPSIRLGEGEDSGYRLNVDGIPGRSFEDVNILAKDSIFVFIETTLDTEDIPSILYEDQILFDEGDREQKVQLVSLVKDAYFLYPDKDISGEIETLVFNGEDTEIQGRYLNENHPENGNEFVFTNEKPYIIYGYMMVGTPDNQAKTLIMEAGAQVHFHANSGLYVAPNCSLHILGERNVEGQPETEVIIQGDRLEPEYENIPGQWGTINLLTGSIHNIIEYATIKNGTIGLIVQGISSSTTPTLEIKNSKIFNHLSFGMVAVHSFIEAKNLASNNCGSSGFAGMYGGAYNFTHCSFANSWSGARSTPNIWLIDSNKYLKNEDDPLEYLDLYFANFTNCIMDGNGNIEMEFDREGTDNEFNFKFTNNLIRFNDINNIYADNPLYDFENTDLYANNIFNGEPDFKDLLLNELVIGENSDANANADTTGTAVVPLDITGKTRANPADIGAYEHIIFEDE